MKSQLVSILVIASLNRSVMAIDAPIPPKPVQQAATQPSVEAEQILRVFKLNNSDAMTLAKTLTSLVKDSRCVADANTNAVIISATQKRMAEIEQLIPLLDTSRPMQVFPLVNASPDSIAKTLSAMFPDIRATTNGNSLIVSDDPTTMKIVERLVQQLDYRETLKVNRSIRFIWLMSDMKLAPPPDEMADTVKEVKGLGVQNLSFAAQNIVQSVSNGRFTIASSPGAFPQCRVKIEGTISEETGAKTARLDISLNASGTIPLSTDEEASAGPRPPRPGPSPSDLATVRTTLFVKPGDKEVLAVTPIGASTSVFVIQILNH